MLASRQTFPLIAELLADQQRLDTPAARFAQDESRARLPQLIPLTAPKPGEQYAFEVDLDACTGCKACVAACHALNGLDDNETWRDVGMLVSDAPRHPFTQTVTTACHHCADPACLNGCPVLAYEKDPVTGIVRHLDDQCIGCSYCILKCPYDVPKYSSRLGIVRKCDMCHSRLAHGEAPACAQACPTHAIRITSVPVPAASTAAAAFLPAAPAPEYTRPTTRYLTRRNLPPNLVAGDASTLCEQPAHWPLVLMLTLVAHAVGCSGAAFLAGLSHHGVLSRRLAVAAITVGFLGVLVGTAHLGQPRRAWRLFLGLRRSWLSREAVMFGVWLVAASATALRPTVPLLGLAAALGAAALGCSVMIYVDTRRTFWRLQNTALRFFGSAAVLGAASAIVFDRAAPVLPFAAGTVAALLGLKLFLESAAVSAYAENPWGTLPAHKIGRLLRGPLRTRAELRVACGFVAIVAAVLIATGGASAARLSVPLAIAALAGELLERALFFQAVDAPKMPGMPGSTTS